MPPFLSMTGSTLRQGSRSRDGWVRGTGPLPRRHAPGSAELIMRAVQRLQGSRTVATFFAETDPGNYRKLNAVVREYAATGLPCRGAFWVSG